MAETCTSRCDFQRGVQRVSHAYYPTMTTLSENRPTDGTMLTDFLGTLEHLPPARELSLTHTLLSRRGFLKSNHDP